MLSWLASVVLLRGILSRPRRKKDKSMFTVLTSDMVEERGAPPVKSIKQNRFFPFIRGYGRRKRTPLPGKNGKKESIFVVFTADMVK